MKAVHKVCFLLKKWEALERGDHAKKVKCDECPASDNIKGLGRCVRGCRARAEEFVNIVKFGNPFGKKYQNTRRSWPDGSKYTDKFSKARRG